MSPGKTTTVAFLGENLNGAEELWTSFPAKVARVSSDKTNDPVSGKVTFQLSVPKDAPLGIGAVQLTTTNGASDLFLFMIDDLPNVTKSGTNKTIASAQELKLPLAHHGLVPFHHRRRQKVSHRIRHHHRPPVRRKQHHAIPQRIQLEASTLLR